MKKTSTSQEDSASSSTVRAIRRLMVMLIYAGSLLAPSASHGVELKAQTQRTWNAYLQAANPQMDSQTSFLWVDQLPERLQRVRGGEILVSSIGKKTLNPWNPG